MCLLDALTDKALDDDAARDVWTMPIPSDETLDFLGQLLQEHRAPRADRSAARGPVIDSPLARLESWRATYVPGASELQFAYALRAFRKGWPRPSLDGTSLRGANLEGWRIGSVDEDPVAGHERLFCHRLDLRGATLRRSRWCNVDLSDTALDGADAAQMEISHSRLDGSSWAGAETAGIRFFPDSIVPSAIRSEASAASGESHGGPGRCLWAGHFVRCIALGADGGMVASGGEDGTVRLWSAEDGACLVLRRSAASVRELRLTADGRSLLVAADGVWTLMSVPDGQPTLTVFNGRRGVAVFRADDGDGYLAGSIWSDLHRFGEDASGRPDSWPVDAPVNGTALPWVPFTGGCPVPPRGLTAHDTSSVSSA